MYIVFDSRKDSPEPFEYKSYRGALCGMRAKNKKLGYVRKYSTGYTNAITMEWAETFDKSVVEWAPFVVMHEHNFNASYGKDPTGCRVI